MLGEGIGQRTELHLESSERLLVLIKAATVAENFFVQLLHRLLKERKKLLQLSNALTLFFGTRHRLNTPDRSPQ